LTTTIVVAIAAGAAALGLLLVVLWLVRGAKGAQGDERLAELVSDMNARMETMVGELSEALEHAQEEGRRNRMLGELAGTIDLDEVLTRTLDAAGAMPGVDAALARLDNDGATPIIATLGLTTEEAQRQAIAGPPGGPEARSISLVYQYPAEMASNDGPKTLIHSGLAVPIQTEHDSIGFIAVFSRARSHTWNEDEVRELEELALRAGPAIENAKRFREARQLADLDALTGLHNRRYFHETLGREVARAHRYSRQLALIVLDLDDFKAINDRIGHLAGDAVIAESAERVRDVVRSADIACRVGGDEFAVIMPESTLADADQLYRRLQATVSARPIGQAGRLSFSAGVAELKPEDDPTTFFERADEALYVAKERGKAQVVASNAAS
jgi:diguanylate cyclase (GGDEF)-like protein